jgi:hypothetical protein
MLYAVIVLAAALVTLCGLYGILWRSRAKEQRAVVAAIAHGADRERMVFNEAVERIAAMRDDHTAEKLGLDLKIGEHVKTISELRLEVAQRDGANAALTTYMQGNEERLRVIEDGHKYHIVGATEAHRGVKYLLHECTCGQRLAAPAGFVQLVEEAVR